MTGETARNLYQTRSTQTGREVPCAAMFSQYYAHGFACRGLVRAHRPATTPTWLPGRPTGRFHGKTFRGCCEQDVPRTDRPVRQPARRRTDQDLSSARSSASLEPDELDHDGLRPTDLSARIGATDGDHARCSPTREEPFRRNCSDRFRLRTNRR